MGRYPTFSPDSRYFVALESLNHLWLWNTDTWKPLHRIEATWINHISFSPNSSFLGICGDELALWSIETGECIFSVGSYSEFMAFTPDWASSMLVASCFGDEVMRICRLDVSHKKLDAEDSRQFFHVAVSPDARFVAALHYPIFNISIWSGTTGRRLRVLNSISADASYICRPAFSPNSKLLAHGTRSVTIWDVSTGQVIYELQCPESASLCAITRVVFSIDSIYLAAGKGSIYIWHIDTRQCVYEHKFVSFPYNEITSLAISPDLTHVASVCNSTSTRSWRLDIMQRCTGQYISSHGDGRDATVAFSSDSAILVLISREQVELLETTSGSCLQRFDLQGFGYLATFDQTKDLIYTCDSMIRKKNWNVWEEIPASWYSYVNAWDFFEHPNANWITRSEERVLYLPPDFRPLFAFERGDNFDISDSLVAFLNESQGIVVIKFPLRNL